MRKLLSVILAILCLLGAVASAEEEVGGNSFLLRIWDESGLTISYLRFDQYIGENYAGLVCSCPNEGEDFYRFPYETENPEELQNLRIEMSYGISDLLGSVSLRQLDYVWRGHNAKLRRHDGEIDELRREVASLRETCQRLEGRLRHPWKNLFGGVK